MRKGAKMPWKVSDVDKFKKGLSDEDKKKWIEIANNSLKQCTEKGGDQLDCEAQAIRIANSKFSADKTIRQTKYAHEVIKEGDLQMETRLQLAMNFAKVKAESDYQMVLPVGVFYSDWYGEIIITNSFAEAMVSNWKNKVMGNREPFIDTLHDMGKANGWIEDLEARDDGLYAKIRWTDDGKELVEKEYFKYFSASIGAISHLESGDRKWPVLFAVALCNTPVMNLMPQAHLSAMGTTDGWETMTTDRTITFSSPQEETMEITFSDVLTFAEDIKPAEKTALLAALGVDQTTDLSGQVSELTLQVETLQKTNKDLSEEVETLRASAHSSRKLEVIDKALSEGRILPKDKEYWEERFDLSPDFTADILSNLPKAVDFTEHGDGNNGSGETLDEEAYEAYLLLTEQKDSEEARKEFTENNKDI
jgi:hypothetical protein